MFLQLLEAVVTGAVIYMVYSVYNRWSTSRRTRAINLARIAVAQGTRKSQVEEVRRRVATRDKEVCGQIEAMDDHTLIDQLQTGSISASDALLYFQWRALAVHDECNCCVDFLLEATDRAVELDRQYEGGKEKPLLFGLPFSVKENFQVKGYATSRGLAGNLEAIAPSDSSIVAHLISLGAVPFVRSNVPQTMMSLACSNPVYGTTLNPHKPQFTPGGSSGGEACLVARRACVFGTGSDLAGSLRIPALCCGVTTVKCSAARLRCTGVRSAYPGNIQLHTGYGYFTRDVRMMEMLLSVTLCSTYFERVPRCIPLTYRLDAQDTPSLKIAYYEDDGFLTPLPACRRAVRETVAALRAQGHHLVEYRLPRIDHLVHLFYTCLTPDGGRCLLDEVHDEPSDIYVMDVWRGMRMPNVVRAVAATLMALRSKPLASLIGATVQDNVHLTRTFADVHRYAAGLADEWVEEGIDALLCPAFPITAPSYDMATKLSAVCYATGIFNMLDMVAGCLPVTRVRDDDGEEEVAMYEDPLRCMMQQATRGSVGMPVNVQVVTMPFKEERCVAILRAIEQAIDTQ